jgi:hypothetical protein
MHSKKKILRVVRWIGKIIFQGLAGIIFGVLFSQYGGMLIMSLPSRLDNINILFGILCGFGIGLGVFAIGVNAFTSSWKIPTGSACLTWLITVLLTELFPIITTVSFYWFEGYGEVWEIWISRYMIIAVGVSIIGFYAMKLIVKLPIFYSQVFKQT